jgi:hypothetical protein
MGNRSRAYASAEIDGAKPEPHTHPGLTPKSFAGLGLKTGEPVEVFDEATGEVKWTGVVARVNAHNGIVTVEADKVRDRAGRKFAARFSGRGAQMGMGIAFGRAVRRATKPLETN